jgi:SAM-dependent methyltransferase
MKEGSKQASVSATFEFDVLGEAKNYRAALLSEFSSFVKGRVLEVGSGIGQITELLLGLPAVEFLQAVEPVGAFCEQFRLRLPEQSLIEGTVKDVPIDTEWDAILSVNVLEHIQADDAELKRYHHFLKKRKGALNLFVPARPEIFAPLDHDFGHHRRYTKAGLKRKLEQAGFEIVRLRYFNFAGYFAWWTMFCLLRKRRFSLRSVRFFDRVIFPVFNGIETKVISPPCGQSLLAVARAFPD